MDDAEAPQGAAAPQIAATPEGVAPISPADFVARIVADPAAPPAVVALSGYPGRSAREGCARLYLSPDLAFWLDIPAEAVVHVQPVAGDPVGAAVLAWIRGDADVTGGNRWSPAPDAAQPSPSPAPPGP